MNSMQSMKYHIMLWRFCGLWPPKQKSMLYRIYGGLFYILFCTLFPLTLIIKVILTENFNELIMTMLPCFSVALASIKGFNVYLKQSKFYELFNVMKQLDQSIETDQQKLILKSVLRDSQNIFNLLLFFYALALTSALAAVFRSDERILMWPSWYPFDWKSNNLIYYSILFYQYVSNFFVVLIDASVDSYGAGLNNILSGHIDLLKLRLKNVTNTIMLYDNNNNNNNNNNFNNESENNIIYCIKDHKLCYEFSNLLDDILSIAYLVQFGISGLILCVTTFQLSVTSPLENFSYFWFVLSYLICMSLEIFLPCYFGTVVTMKSSQLTYGLFQCNWLEQSKNFKKIMMIFCERSLKPIKPFVGGLFLLGLPTFVAILRSAYSLLALLKNIQYDYNE